MYTFIKVILMGILFLSMALLSVGQIIFMNYLLSRDKMERKAQEERLTKDEWKMM